MSDSAQPMPPGGRAVPPGVPTTYEYPQVTATRLLDDAAQDFPETDAIDSSGHRLTYRALADQVDRLATAFAEMGLRDGDRVGVLLPACPQRVVTLFAAWRVGAVVVLLEPDEQDLQAPINETGCRIVVCLAHLYARLGGLKGRLATVTHILATGVEDYLPFPRNVVAPLTRRRRGAYRRIPRREGVTRFKDLIRRTVPAPPERPTRAGVPAIVAEGYVATHAELVAGAFQLRLWVPDIQAGRERLVNLASPASLVEVGATLGLGVLAASTLVLPTGAGSPPTRALRRSHPTLLVGDPGMFTAVSGGDPIESLRVGLATGPLDPATVQAIHDASGARVRGGLAVPGVSALAHANPVYGRARLRSAGLALPDTETAVVAEDGSPLPQGAVGALAVRGPSVAGARWSTGARAAVSLGDPWVATPFRGHLDGDGYLWLDEPA